MDDTRFLQVGERDGGRREPHIDLIPSGNESLTEKRWWGDEGEEKIKEWREGWRVERERGHEGRTRGKKGESARNGVEIKEGTREG